MEKDIVRSTSVDTAQELRLSSIMPSGVDKERLESLIPELKKKDVMNMQPDERDAQIEHSEQMTI